MLRISEEQEAFQKLDTALALIRRHAPAKLRVLQMDLDSILVAGLPDYRAIYVHKMRMVEFYHRYLLDPDTTPETLACVLIHEAQHARLFRLGFGYEEPIRGRIERLCFRAERNFARLLPAGEDLIAEADSMIAAEPDSIFSDEARRQAKLEALRELGGPNWLVSTMDWISRRRLAKHTGGQ